VAFSYIDAVEGILAPSLIAMSIVKFVIVVGYFMHLKFDSRLFRRLFVAGIALAIFCFTIMLTTFHVWTR
jgi:cytochrome c oxidase subunit 4